MSDVEPAAPQPTPDFLEPEIALQRIQALTTTARTTWLVLLGFLAFIGTTLLSVRDVDSFSVDATTQLPIVDIAIPTTTFFWTAALLAAILHTYFHVFLLKLWDALAEAPPDIGVSKLGDRVLPWLVNDWALRRRADRSTTERPMDWLADTVTFLLIWLATPLVLAGFWWRSMPAHEFWLTLAIAFALAVSLYASLHGWRRANSRLNVPGLSDGDSASVEPFPLSWRRTALSVAVLLAVISALRTEVGAIRIGPYESRGFLLARADLVDAQIAIEPADWRDPEIARRRFHVDWCADAGIPAHACETPEHPDQELARRRWCEEFEIEVENGACAVRFSEIDATFADEWRIERQASIDNIPGPDLRRRDLRGANAAGAFLVGVDLRQARLEGADLSRARLEGANLGGARLEVANLGGARLEGVNLEVAQLEGANLGRARLDEARLEGADLQRARLEGASIVDARLEAANLRRARLEAADLRRARLEGADLWAVRLEGADLRWARLEGADLWAVRLEGADLREARLHSADWLGATIGPSPAHSADFAGGKNLTQSRLAQVIGDADTILPLDAETGEQLHVWSCWAEQAAEIFVRRRTKHRHRPNAAWLWQHIRFEGGWPYLLLRPEDLLWQHTRSEGRLWQHIRSEGWLCAEGEEPRPVGRAAEEPAAETDEAG